MDDSYYSFNDFYKLKPVEKKLLIYLSDMMELNIGMTKYNFLSFDDIEEINKLLNLGSIETTTRLIKNLGYKVFQVKEKLYKYRMLQASLFLCCFNCKKHGLNGLLIKFNPDVIPYILEFLKQINHYATKLENGYSIIIYDMLRLNSTNIKKIISMDLSELKINLGLYNKYKDYFNFKRNILLKAQKDINTYTDIGFSFNEIRKSNKVIKIQFKIVKSPNKE